MTNVTKMSNGMCLPSERQPRDKHTETYGYARDGKHEPRASMRAKMLSKPNNMIIKMLTVIEVSYKNLILLFLHSTAILLSSHSTAILIS